MPDAPSSIFRHDALRRYAAARDQAVLPRLVAPRTFVSLWVLAGLLVMSGAVALFPVIGHLWRP